MTKHKTSDLSKYKYDNYSEFIDLNAEAENDMFIPQTNLEKLFHKIIESRRHYCNISVRIKNGKIHIPRNNTRRF
jgi:hypothetical protein